VLDTSDASEECFRTEKWGDECLETHALLLDLLEAYVQPPQARYLLLSESRTVDDVQIRQFQAVWNRFLGRFTTKPEDVHGILANMLDFSAKEILSLPSDQRMKALLYDQKLSPLCLLYNDVPRLQSDRPNECWVPAYSRGLRIERTNLATIENEGIAFPLRPNNIAVFLKLEGPCPTQFCTDISLPMAGWRKT
jgi:hypothetical protein